MTARRLLAVTLAVAVLGLAACGDPSSSDNGKSGGKQSTTTTKSRPGY
jgi:uncharacterized lipoprotein